MLEILQFTFSDFWHFAGVVVLMSIAVTGLGYVAAIISAARGK